eukprot:15354190-Ditylum_brightwellii.AAC.1
MWDDTSIPMKAMSAQTDDSFHIEDSEGINNMVGQIAGDKYKTILKVTYEKSDLKKEIEENCPQLNLNQRKQLTLWVLGKTPNTT